MKKFLLLSAVFLSIFSTSFAADKIYTMGYLTCIIADDLEWSCGVNNGKVPGFVGNIGGNKNISGSSKHFPVSFAFFAPLDNARVDNTYMELALRAYALNTNTVLLNVTTKETSTVHKIVEADYFNNTSSGHLQYRLERIDGRWFVMFSKINSELLDDHSRTILYNSAHDLITTLYNPKALMLWTEEVKNTKKLEEFKSFRGQGNP